MPYALPSAAYNLLTTGSQLACSLTLSLLACTVEKLILRAAREKLMCRPELFSDHFPPFFHCLSADIITTRQTVCVHCVSRARNYKLRAKVYNFHVFIGQN